MKKQKPTLGDTVRHTITKFEGVVVAFTTWLNGCERISVQPQKLDPKEGKPREIQVFDIQELEVVKSASHPPVVHAQPAPRVMPASRDTGGPRQAMPRGQETPRRR